MSAATDPVVAESPHPRWIGRCAVGVAAFYLTALFFDGASPKTSQRLVPATALYFVQATCLFPRAGRMAIDYRLEGFSCQEERFVELEPAPYFPIRVGDKENRLHRAAHFHRQNRPVMQALEQYVLHQENAVNPRFGGVRLSSLRFPLPAPGEPVERWAPPPLVEHPPDLVKHWFYTPVSRREQNCQALDQGSTGGEP